MLDIVRRRRSGAERRPGGRAEGCRGGPRGGGPGGGDACSLQAFAIVGLKFSHGGAGRCDRRDDAAVLRAARRGAPLLRGCAAGLDSACQPTSEGVVAISDEGRNHQTFVDFEAEGGQCRPGAGLDLRALSVGLAKQNRTHVWICFVFNVSTPRGPRTQHNFDSSSNRPILSDSFVWF